MNEHPRRLAIMADGSLNFHRGKTAASILAYRPHDVAVVIDRQHAGRTTQEVVGLGGAIPIVEDIDQALACHPNAFSSASPCAAAFFRRAGAARSSPRSATASTSSTASTSCSTRTRSSCGPRRSAASA